MDGSSSEKNAVLWLEVENTRLNTDQVRPDLIPLASRFEIPTRHRIQLDFVASFNHIPSQFVSDKTISKNNDLHRDATKSPKSSISFWMFLVYPHLALQVFFTLSQRRHLLTDVLLAAESALCDSTLA